MLWNRNCAASLPIVYGCGRTECIELRMDRTEAGQIFQDFLDRLPRGKATRLHVFTDADADGLPAAALLVRALRAAGYRDVTTEARRKFENAWMPEVLERVRQRDPQALLVVDLGSRPEPLLPGVPTLLIDHHAPLGVPPDGTLLTGYGTEPTPTSGLLALWCAEAIAPVTEDALQWMAGISLLSDLGDKAPFTELEESRKRFGVGALKDLTALLNAPRRTAIGNASVALELLLTAETPKQVLKEGGPLLDTLRAAKAEVGEALAAARKTAPKFSTKWKAELGADLAAVRIDTPCQVHPLIAQIWRGQLKHAVIFGVNTGFRPGYVHFSGRAPKGVHLLNFLRKHTPEGADGSYGGGHDQASGGALPTAVWNTFAHDMGFGPEMQVVQAANKITNKALQHISTGTTF